MTTAMVSITESYGARIGWIRPDDAVGLRRQDVPDDVNLVRVRLDRRDDEQWEQLRRAGFVVKPGYVHWVSEVGESEQSYAARLAGKARRGVAYARRRVDDDGVTISCEPLTPDSFDGFHSLYALQIAGMRWGWNFAAVKREEVLDDIDRYIIVSGRRGEELLGACIVRLEPENSFARARFTAYAPEQRSQGLSRVLLWSALNEARARGFARFSLGVDPNLYGHIAEPGLIRFKARLGFVPVPSHHLEPELGGYHAEAVVGADFFADPCVALEYRDSTSAYGVAVITHRRDIDLAEYTTTVAPHGVRLAPSPLQKG
ncbi:GNAT family N-acetyltransferase [Micromonospora echinofusca]|uniref:Acetyltransferase (GNAT) domain-containing protein n=1 Tax=Micromonospora echinofusca TaxID=47858 RepID=A0A1C5GI22_MICEH|nr:GNAT family N-acetyltransferase [Micromonospora echinofusca]SCG19473.1 Acetyltransferase (GNAT) domain-containing protein [Micromonospora echinofusca]